MMAIIYLNMLKAINLKRGGFMLTTGLLMGLLFSFQSKSVGQANLAYNRESRIGIFNEIQLIKKSNQNLNEQVNDLQKELASSSNKEAALESIKKDISRFEMANGNSNLEGPGVSISINGDLESLWFTDMINELFSAGAEAVSLNGFRIVDKNIGFDTMPNGQILLGGEIISLPFKFEAIGDSKAILGSLNQAGGILNRLANYKPKYEIKAEVQNDLKMKKINLE